MKILNFYQFVNEGKYDFFKRSLEDIFKDVEKWFYEYTAPEAFPSDLIRRDALNGFLERENDKMLQDCLDTLGLSQYKNDYLYYDYLVEDITDKIMELCELELKK